MMNPLNSSVDPNKGTDPGVFITFINTVRFSTFLFIYLLHYY